ncbi:MAG: T9SS type A sorting domain-containing protein [Flavobacteriales bacterium]|nr:T9SS type A sorting domain-containing protein [Flavobacteriales bacterium]
MKQFLVIIMVLGYTFTHAQYSPVSSSSSSSNASGTVNYTIGQVFYETSKSQEGSVANGLQISFESQSDPQDSLPVMLEELNRSFTVFPNPAIESITIRFEDINVSNRSLHYNIYDLSSKIVKTGALESMRSDISVKELTKGTYILEIGNKSESKRIKIVKQ